MSAENSAKTIGRPFPKGVSGNKGGRPKGFARLIRQRSKNGKELVTFALEVLRGDLSLTASHRARLEKIVDIDKRELAEQRLLAQLCPSVGERLQALDWLRVNGWGKAPEAVMDDPLAEMTEAQLIEALEEVLAERRKAVQPASPGVTQ